MIVGREIEDCRHEVSRDWRFAMADLMETKIEVELADVRTGVEDWLFVDGWRRVCWQCSRLLRQ